MPKLDGNAGEQWASAEFVVVLPHLDAVRAELDAFAGPTEITEEHDEALGLALIRIGNVDLVADRINQRLGAGGLRDRRRASRPEPEYPIERVLREIRESCAIRNGGWTPNVGKNRTLDGVHAAQHVGIGRNSLPEVAAAVELPMSGTINWADVGLLDTGLWPHPQLNGRYLTEEPDVLFEVADQYPYLAGHATFVAGMILQHAPNAQLHVRRVLDERTGTALVWDVATEMVRFARSVDVLNLSFCCFTADNEPPLVLARAIERIGPETVIVAAAGNHGGVRFPVADRTPGSPKAPIWPAAFDQVAAVGAHDVNGDRADFSPDAAWVDLTAPGDGVVSLYLDGLVHFDDLAGDLVAPEVKFGGCAKWSGTSFAAAAVSGAIARRIRPGTAATDALRELLRLPPGNPEGIWRFRPSSAPPVTEDGDTAIGGHCA